MNKLNQFVDTEVFVGKVERQVCHLLSDKLGLRAGGDPEVGK
jgi:hypothetical protein